MVETSERDCGKVRDKNAGDSKGPNERCCGVQAAGRQIGLYCGREKDARNVLDRSLAADGCKGLGAQGRSGQLRRRNNDTAGLVSCPAAPMRRAQSVRSVEAGTGCMGVCGRGDADE